ncbi:MAG: BMC domain-containing protein [bacterium]
MELSGVALGLLESASIAGGVRAADEVIKTAPVELVEACPISPGKFLVILTGGVAEVEASLDAGRRVVGTDLVDELFLAFVHPTVAPAIQRRGVGDEWDEAIAVVETRTVAAAIVGADAAVKTARVRLLEIGPGVGIGGKGFLTLTGSVSDVEAAAEAARGPIDRRGAHVRTEVLAGPDTVLARRVARGLTKRNGERLGEEG